SPALTEVRLGCEPFRILRWSHSSPAGCGVGRGFVTTCRMAVGFAARHRTGLCGGRLAHWSYLEMMNRRHHDSSPLLMQEVSAVVKWYNPTKGFGFVQLNDGSPDAFLHVSIVEQSGHGDLPEGTIIVCDISEGRKGPQVAVIHRIES